jgi:FkbM family methyltransferase
MSNPNILKYRNEIGAFYSFKTDCAFHYCLSKGNVWDAEILNSVVDFIPNEGTILDIGSHIGSHSIFYSKKRPRCTIHAYEPQIQIRKLLELNVLENNISNIVVHDFGLGHKEGEVHMANDFKSDGYPAHLRVDYNSTDGVNFGGLGITNDPLGEKIVIKTVDSQKLDNVKYIKIDVEGAEDLVVYGARETIEKYHPVLFIEQSDKNLTHLYVQDNKDLETFNTTDFLLKMGYKRIVFNNENYLYVYHQQK